MIRIINSEYLAEMATVHRDLENNITVCVNPDRQRRGERYFKFYNASHYEAANKVIRISFDLPQYIYHTNTDGKEDWILNGKEKKELIEILLSQSKKYSGYSVWDAAKFDWNNEALDEMLNSNEYIAGKYDEKFKDNLNYIPSTLNCPNYLELK